MDYSDEVSRRFMISLLQDVLSVPTVPLGCVPEVVKFLSVLSPAPRERVGIFGEILMELVEERGGNLMQNASFPSANESSPHSLHPSKEANVQRETLLLRQLKCLQILNEFIKESPALAFDQHPILAAFFNELVIPSINSPLALIQEAGLECLGAYCLLYRPLALEYLGLVLDFWRMGHPEIRAIALKLLFDVEIQFSLRNEASYCCFREALMQQEAGVGCVAVEGVCKVLLVRKPGPEWQECLKFMVGTLLSRYFEAGAEARVRQSLSYFFSVWGVLMPGW